ncbi:MAG: EutN/CcmL family microcompartment protein [Christensenella sp.]|nr:EutN/CcmL family microcompartment protein [Christensenella sp.]
MRTAKVVGSVVASIKNDNLTGIKLLAVQLIDDGVPGNVIVAADATRQAGENDFVYLMESKEAGLLFRNGNVPVDASICGFIDSYNEML